ncbi:TIGR01212 family radical SAM protein [Balneolales bacterium ANBcel1]|nr:TIGR01212 family radical SAM protein [Balneolales bacterium ANBcel1]
MKPEKPYSDYHSYLKRHLGAVTYKVSVDGGFTCPNIDGTVALGGCAYCNNRSFVPKYLDRSTSIRDQISQGVASQRERYGAERFLAYFQAYSNTHDSVDRLEERYQAALAHPAIDGLVIGTRADCLPGPVVSLLESLARDYYMAVEIGIESVYDETLHRINRGHDFATIREAFERLSGRGIHLGAHLILGFPWESRRQWLDTAGILAGLPMEYLKIHHLQVVKGTALAQEYASKPFTVFSFGEWVDLICDFLELLPPRIAIARLCGSAPPNLLIAPRWGRRKHPEVISAVMTEMTRKKKVQGARLL